MLKNVNKNVDSKNDCIFIVNSPDVSPTSIACKLLESIVQRSQRPQRKTISPVTNNSVLSREG